MTSLKYATRGSALAIAQSDLIANKLREQGHHVERVIVKTKGDQSSASLREIGGQGAFTAAVSKAIIKGQADFAVHSLKDLPTEEEPKLVLAAIPKREDARDLLISKEGLQNLHCPSVGTGSLRRQLQLDNILPDSSLKDLRGNIDTRLNKVIKGELDAILLAAAGVNRLRVHLSEIPGFGSLTFEPLSTEQMIPAVGQGALALECRRGDEEIYGILSSLNDEDTASAVTIERNLLSRLGSGCQIPFAAHVAENNISLFLADPESGAEWKMTGESKDAEQLMDQLLKIAQSTLNL